MKAKKKLLALAMSALTGVVTFGLALHLRVPSTVSAEDATATVVPPAATNLEDLVNIDPETSKSADIRWGYNNTGLHTLYYGRSEDNFVNAGIQDPNDDGSLTYAMFDEAYDEDNATHKANYTYFKKGASEATSETGAVINANKYDGNYSFFANATAASKTLQAGGILLPNVNDKDQIISFNMNYTDRRHDFYSRWVKSTTNSYYADPAPAKDSTPATGSYYGITFNINDSHFIAFRNKVYNISNNTTTINNSAVTRSTSYIYQTYNIKNPDNTVSSFDELLVKGDDINVTYGTFDVGEGESKATYTYFKLYNLTKDLLVFEETVNVGVDNTVYEGDNQTWATPCMMKIGFQQRGDWDNADYDRTPVTIAGVTEPLLQSGFDADAVEGDYMEDNALETVTLPTNYTWKEETQLLQAGTNEYDAVYEYEYYGKTYTKDCKVTVTAGALPHYTLTLKDMSGEVIGTDTVKQGEDYTFKALDREKAFVAYVVGDKLYNVGDTVAVGADSEATLWEVDFKMNEKVSVRLVSNENGEGGLRYMAQMPASDWAVISESVTFKTMIVPTDLIDGDLNADEVGAQSKPATVADMTDGGVDYKIALFAITDIMHMNYDRKFTGAAYLEVTYADGQTDYVMTDTKSVSAYDLAVEAYAANAKEIVENGAPLYHDNDVAILKQYINGVVEISYVENGDTLTIALAENGLDLDRAYTLDSAKTSVTKNGEAYTVSVTLNVADSVLETLLVDGESQAPVILRNDNNQDEYTSVAVTREYDATAHTLKLTFDVNA
ncbi:MAG: hypothetical protein IJA89_01730 [Clostridia bacterium]|nr:hypothetical protein [Clostridia bacterium]